MKTAKEIRKMTKAIPSSKANRILKQIEKEIVKCAKKGKCSTVHSEYNSNEDTVQEVMVELQLSGYKVSALDISDPRENDGYCVQLTIKW